MHTSSWVTVFAGQNSANLPVQPRQPIQHTWLLGATGHKYVETNTVNLMVFTIYHIEIVTLSNVKSTKVLSKMRNIVMTIYWCSPTLQNVWSWKFRLHQIMRSLTWEQWDIFSYPMHQWSTSFKPQTTSPLPNGHTVYQHQHTLAPLTYKNSHQRPKLPILWLILHIQHSFWTCNSVMLARQSKGAKGWLSKAINIFFNPSQFKLLQ